VTAFIFSTENWNRSKDEVGYLMGLLPIVFKKNIQKLINSGIRVHWLGNYDRLSEREITMVEDAVEKTKNLKKGNLCFCFNYGGQQEIVDAVKKLVASGAPAGELTTESLRKHLYAPEVPDVDVIIRTSGEQRISNFMLWRAAYSELVFVPKHWPAFTAEDFDEALAEYAHRQRRFGC
jgi:undecaprenyl diphosphate synthase